MKFLKKLCALLLSILASLILLALLAWTGLMIAKFVIYNDYMTNRQKESPIPALNDGFVPQGLACTEDELYIHSGYNGKAMEMHLVQNGEEKQILPLMPDGSPCEGHGGGVSIAEDFVYVANEASVIVFRLSDLTEAKDGDEVTATALVPMDTAASFCFSDGNQLYVGEFFRAVDYEIDESHAYTTPAGDENRALVSCYQLNEDGSLADTYPLYSISIPHQVQGFAVKDGVYMISCSWGVNSSELKFYDGIVDSGRTIDVSGKEVPLYYMDSSTHFKTLKMPAFSEGLDVIGDRVYISFESACNKYIVGKLFFAYNVVSYPIENPS